jgi:AcrR family transcriptional regulator
MRLDTLAPPRRLQKRAETRQRLLDAAAAVIAEKGLAGASVMEIAQRAGLTTGAIYSNFRSKEALLLAVVSDQMEQVMGEPPPANADLVEVARQAARMVDKPQVRDLLHSQMELYFLGLRDPAIRAEMQAEQEELTSSLAETLAGARAPAKPTPTPTLTQLAEVFFATVQGLQQHRLMFPEAVPESVFTWWAETMIAAAKRAAKSQ